jgi:hypothetical protein
MGYAPPQLTFKIAIHVSRLDDDVAHILRLPVGSRFTSALPNDPGPRTLK